MKILILLLFVLSFYSCREATRVDPIIEDERERDTKTKDQNKTSTEEVDWSNPVLIISCFVRLDFNELLVNLYNSSN